MGLIDDVMTAPAWEAEMGKSTIHRKIRDAAKSAGINPKEFLQLAEMESGFDPQAESPAGYRGLFQINPEDRDVKAHASSNLPFITPGLYDHDVNLKFATKRYKEIEDDTFLKTAIRYNQGNKGGGEILAAYSSGKSIKAELLDPKNIARREQNNPNYTPAPWNRTKKILNNLTDTSLNDLAKIYGLSEIKAKGDRKLLINSMIDKKSTTYGKLVDNPLLVKLYVGDQQEKVKSSGSIVDRILKEI